MRADTYAVLAAYLEMTYQGRIFTAHQSMLETQLTSTVSELRSGS
ncbi:hypothetical protein ACFQX6_65940 [Streptosporangium lutulentum]